MPSPRAGAPNEVSVPTKRAPRRWHHDEEPRVRGRAEDCSRSSGMSASSAKDSLRPYSRVGCGVFATPTRYASRLGDVPYAKRTSSRRRSRRFLALAALLAAACAMAACSHVGPVDRSPVLDTLGIPPLDQVTLTPVFASGFERDADFADFYVTPQSALTRHEVRSGIAHSGSRAHVAWLTGAVGSEPVDGPNHRGYPTIQLSKRPAGTCTTPCLIEFWARIADVDLHPGEWLSLATFSADPSDRWARVITVNVGIGRLAVPVPRARRRHGKVGTAAHGHSLPARQVGPHHDVVGPRPGRWCRSRVAGRCARLAACVNGGDGSLDQMHFGLYAGAVADERHRDERRHLGLPGDTSIQVTPVIEQGQVPGALDPAPNPAQPSTRPEG